MSADANAAPNVKSMDEYLQESYRMTEILHRLIHRLDQRLHSVNADIKDRLMTLHFATSSDEVRARKELARKHDLAGERLPDAISLDEFDKRASQE